MIRVSKNYKLGRVIHDLSEICRLANEGKAICFKHKTSLGETYNMKPAAFFQNWSISTANRYEFYTVEKIE